MEFVLVDPKLLVWQAQHLDLEFEGCLRLLLYWVKVVGGGDGEQEQGGKVCCLDGSGVACGGD